ncbi:MAG TPA: presqualene diphosphate synthase HpnD [Dongiaceae bacterium]|jgi:phytoene synthase|nr:presqualene diphosphate synthase HpnD [Dongiaceae bacterium]
MSGNGAVTANMAGLQSDIAAKVQASGTSFYAAMRLLPQARRDAMFAIYAFCREVDDIADEPAEIEDKKRRLEGWRMEIAKLYDGVPLNPIAQALLPCVKQFNLRWEDFLAVIDGMEMDAVEDIIAPSMDKLDLYCDRVASAVGRLSVRAFGATEPEADQVAHHLGRALQLTNILRDLGEDAERGRLYLPVELLHAAGIFEHEPMKVVTHPKVREACQALARRARQHFAGAHVAMAACAKGPMRPAAIMGGVYRAILERLVKADWRDPFARISLPKWQKIWLAFRYGFL